VLQSNTFATAAQFRNLMPVDDPEVTVNSRNTVVRSLHDIGLAAWFGGALMGAIGLNGAANEVKDPTDRITVASAGWARWAPVNAAAIGAHVIGGIGLIVGNRTRLAVHGTPERTRS
jgi:hypothetical protein